MGHAEWRQFTFVFRQKLVIVVAEVIERAETSVGGHPG